MDKLYVRELRLAALRKIDINFFGMHMSLTRRQDMIYNAFPDTDGALYVAVILGSDKTTVSVATGHVEYHPLYLSIGNIHNGARRAHRNTVIPIAFLAIPKCLFCL
jgi:hypothetical protein